MLSIVVGGCETSPPAAPPMARLQDRTQRWDDRARAISLARDDLREDELQAFTATVSSIAWEPREPAPLRAAAVRALMLDADPNVHEAARTRAKEVLPQEASREVVLAISTAAADRGWTDFTPSLIQSYSRVVRLVPNEDDRAERQALDRLHPGKACERVVFDTFADAGLWGDNIRGRMGAWDLLGRLDPTGSVRSAWIDAAPGGEPYIDALKACRRDLRAVPVTADQLKWLMSLRGSQNSAWWAEASSAIAGITQQADLSVRHAEIIRWARAERPAWLAASRESLLSGLRASLATRDHHPRTIDGMGTPLQERLGQVEDRLSWADVLTILVLDHALRSGDMLSRLCQQATLDQKDQTTEYGGTLNLVGKSWDLTFFPPRPGERQGDHMFIASPDMIARSDRSAAHYHLHAQTWSNSEYAGPSSGDLAYARRFGRACLVFTAIDDCELAVDYYQPDGVVVDIGTLRGR